MANNRRRHTRVRARGLAAHLRTEHGRSACQVENVSMGGLFVRTDRLEEVGTEIFVDLVKPGWKRQLTMNARVTSRVDAIDGRLSKRMPGMGLQFLRPDEKQHDRLASLLRELGASDEDLQVTLPDDNAEPELQALDLDAAEAQPLDASEPLWKQVMLVETGPKQKSLVEDAIEGALREVYIPEPGPLHIEPEPMRPSLPTRPPPPAPEKPAGGPDLAVENAKLMLQVRGLVMQLSDAQQQLSERDLEIERLKDELDTARAALERATRRN